MSFLDVNVSLVRLNIEREQIANSFFVCKSNVYGMGFRLLSYLKKQIKAIAVADIDEFMLCKDYLDERTEYLIMYSNMTDERVRKITFHYKVYFIINSMKDLEYVNVHDMDKSRFYIRVDEFLGLHGITLRELYTVENISEYRGLLVHINEYIAPDDTDILETVSSLADKNGILFNIGGSNAYDYFRRNCRENNYLRCAMRFINNAKAPIITLHLHIINKTTVNGNSMEVGYRSDRKKFEKCTLLTVDIGYGNWPLVSRLYTGRIPLKYHGRNLLIPVYPCMNTMWLCCEDTLDFSDTLILFEDHNDIVEICLALDIDIDEFYTSFNNNITRNYNY
ncbi:MAG: hypothetical protein GX567_05440 [Clostridia bacterium]|nr:hypothetical protein [Clostridia bacterium]